MLFTNDGLHIKCLTAKFKYQPFLNMLLGLLDAFITFFEVLQSGIDKVRPESFLFILEPSYTMVFFVVSF